MINLRARRATADGEADPKADPDSGADPDADSDVDAGDGSGADDGGDTGTGRRSTADLLFLGSIVAALLPIVVATIRAARAGWLPIGDNGYFAIRSQDVFTEHHPLLGTWTSASTNTDTNFNNPGPLLFDLFAVPAKLTNGGIGLAIGVAILNSLAVIGIALLARRRAGPVAGVLAMATVAALCLSMGSELLFDPWQPHSLLLTFLFGILLVWSLAAGDVIVLPWMVFVASLIVQTHLSYGVLITLLGAWGIVAYGLFVRRSRHDDPDSWAARRRSIVRTGVVTLVVGLLCWAQPLYEQFGENEGNLARLARNGTSAQETIGVQTGTRVAADVLTVPPFWFRPSFQDAVRPSEAVPEGQDQLTTVDPSFPVAVGLLAVLALVLAGAALDARRRGDRLVSSAIGTALVALAGAMFTMWKLPLNHFGVPAHHIRWLWPVAAFATFALLLYAARRFERSERSEPSTAAAGSRPAVRGLRVTMAATAVTIVLAVLNLPTHNVMAGPSSDSDAIPIVKEVQRQMASLEDQGTILVDMSGIGFAEPYTGPVMAELQRRHIPFVFEDEVTIRQLGEERRWSGDPVQRLTFGQGERALSVPWGSERVVLVEGLDEDGQRELGDLEDELVDHLDEVGINLTDEGREVARSPKHKVMLEVIEEDAPEGLIEFRGLRYLVENDLLVMEPEWRDRYERFAELQRTWDRHTIALFLSPAQKTG